MQWRMDASLRHSSVVLRDRTMTKFSPQVKFCVKYLLENGVNSLVFHKIVKELNAFDQKYELVPINKEVKKPFFDELAEKLRELWPPGDKDGKYAWRDSVPNLSKRLKSLWDDRLKGKEFTIDECLVAARKYLAQFEDNVKYMQTLKYFIMKQKSIVEKDGRIKYITESKFADILEGNSELAAMDEWNDILNGSNIDEGELI